MRNYCSKSLRRAAAYNDIWWPSNALLILRIVLVAAVAPLLVRLDLPRLKKLIEPTRVRKSPSTEIVNRIVRYTDLVLSGRVPFVRKDCFRRAIILYYFLRREGLELDLRFGITEPGESVSEGHCWLVKDELPYLEDRDPMSRFKPIISFSQIPPLHADT